MSTRLNTLILYPLSARTLCIDFKSSPDGSVTTYEQFICSTFGLIKNRDLPVPAPPTINTLLFRCVFMSAVDSLTVADSIIFGLPGTGADFGLLRFFPALTANPGSSLNVFSPNGSECVSLYSSTLSFQ